MQKKIALITGGTGFIGKNLALKLLEDEWIVHILIRPNSKNEEIKNLNVITWTYNGNIEELISHFSIIKPDIVFHLASLFLSEHTEKDIYPLFESNLLFGSQILEAMRLNKIKYIVNTGTSWQHYQNNAYNPVCLYAATKQAFESIIEYYTNAKIINCITLKLFDTYGPNDNRKKLFNLLKNSSESEDYLCMSPGQQMIDIVHINDVISAFIIASNRLLSNKVVKHETYAVSSKKTIKLIDLVTLYEKISKKKLSIKWGERPYRDREVMIPWSLGEDLDNWEPKISLELGIKSLFDEN